MIIGDLQKDIIQTVKNGGAGGFTILQNALLDTWMRRLTPIEFKVLVAIYKHVNSVTGSCWASQIEIGEYTGIPRKATISETMKALKEYNLIRTVPAKTRDKNGNFKDSSNEVLVIPIDKVDDKAYIAEVDAMIIEAKFFIVNFDKNGVRHIVSDGSGTACKSAEQFYADREVSRKESIKAKASEAKNTIPAESAKPIGEEKHAENVMPPVFDESPTQQGEGKEPVALTTRQPDNEELMEPGVFYCHKALHTPIAAPTLTWDDNGNLVEINQQYKNCELLGSFTLTDLCDYFYKKAGVKQQNIKRDIGGFRYLFNQMSVSVDFNKLDLALYTIDEAVALAYDMDRPIPKSAVDLSQYLEDGKRLYADAYNSHKQMELQKVRLSA